MRAEFFCEFLLVVAAVDCDSPESHPPRVLNSEMAQPSDTVDRNNVSGASTGVAQRVVNRHPGAHERSSLFGQNVIRNRSQRARRRYHVLRISTIEIEPRHFAMEAHRKITTTTLLAHEVVTAVPADTHSLTVGP